MSSAPKNIQDQDVIPIGAEDLPLYCPGPKAPLWSMHPRIYIEVTKNKVARCQYCSALYALREGETLPGGHH